MKKILILGSTGSIGRQTLDVVRNQPGKFKVIGLACNANTALLREQVREFKPKFVGVGQGLEFQSPVLFCPLSGRKLQSKKELKKIFSSPLGVVLGIRYALSLL